MIHSRWVVYKVSNTRVQEVLHGNLSTKLTQIYFICYPDLESVHSRMVIQVHSVIFLATNYFLEAKDVEKLFF